MADTVRSTTFTQNQQNRTKTGASSEQNGTTSTTRNYNDALTMAFTSHMIVQKALVASERLRSIAQDAMAGRGYDMQEISSAISSLEVDLQAGGTEIAPPPLSAEEGENLFSDTMVPLQETRNFMVRFQESPLLPQEGLEEHIQGLQTRAGAMENALAQQGVNPDIDAMDRTTSAIQEKGEEALTAQGNLVADRVQNLLS